MVPGAAHQLGSAKKTGGDRPEVQASVSGKILIFHGPMQPVQQAHQAICQ
jgi:hypothetical protein